MKFLVQHDYFVSSEDVTAHAALAFSYTALQQTAERMNRETVVLSASKVETYSDEAVASLLQLAWQIIEYADAIRQLIEVSLPEHLPRGELKKLLKTCRALRNDKVHIANKIRNLASKRGRLPLHGVLCWTHFDPEVSQGDYYEMPMISVEPLPYVNSSNGGRVMGGLSFNPVADLGDIPGGVGNFRLFAFEKSMDLTRLTSQLERFSSDLEISWKAILERTNERLTESEHRPVRVSEWSAMASTPFRMCIHASLSEK